MDFRPIKNERRVSTHSNYVDDPDNKDTFPPDAVVSILTWRSNTHRSCISISSKIGNIAPCRCANALRMLRAPSGLPQKATPSKPCKVVRSLNPIVPFRPSPFNKSEQIGNADFTVTLNSTYNCLLYTSPSPRDQRGSRMPSSA